jgi:D-lactate dehydrogenase
MVIPRGEFSMTRIAFFDTKSYDKTYFDQLVAESDVHIHYFESKLNENTALLAKGYDVVCVFVNDHITDAVIDRLYEDGVRLIAMRCAGYNNVDFKSAWLPKCSTSCLDTCMERLLVWWEPERSERCS